VAFIGAIRPLVKGNSTAPPEHRPALLLALGFTISSVTIYAAASALGTALLGDARSSRSAMLAAAGILAVLLLLDAGVLGLRTPMWRRQTPKWFMHQFGPGTSALLWGLDAGLVVTTFRVTSLSWGALTVTLLGLAPWWVGAAYALAFVIPELVLDLVVPVRRDPSGTTDPEPIWLMERLFHLRPALRSVGIIGLLTATAWATVMAAASSG
jgi:hypothetical protein